MAYVVSRRKVTASISDQIASYFTQKRYAVFKEIGLCKRGKLRADFIAVNMKHQIVIIEVKSCPEDFLSDRKWKGYLPYCHKFYFALTSKTYQKVGDLIPKGIGVILVDQNFCFVQNARTREIETDYLLEILTRLAFRQADYNRYKYVRKI